jgi:uncharacterized protein YndB with AHSA1/START domain
LIKVDKLTLHLLPVLLVPFLLAACIAQQPPTPTQEPPPTPTPTSQPTLVHEETSTEQTIGGEGSNIPLPPSCLMDSEHSLLYVNSVDGYCLRYPARFRVGDVLPPGIANLYGPPLDSDPMEPVMAAASLMVERPISDRTLAEAADLWLGHHHTQPPIRRSDTTLDGESAEIVEYPGDRSGARTLFALHEGKLYALSFYPVDERFPQAVQDVEELWQTVVDSFAFLPPETQAADIEAVDTPHIASFQARPAEVEPGDVITLTWEASGERAIICPTTRSVLFTSEDCQQVPPSGETTFTILPEAEETRFVDFLLSVEAGGIASPVVSQVSVVFKCHTTWFFSDEPQAGICPGEPITSYAAAQQFQRGMMIWIEQLGRTIILDQVSSLSHGMRRPVYIVDEPLDIVRDTSAEAITPPSRLYAPGSQFDVIWRGDIGGSPDYREMLGWALALESGYATIWQCDDGLPGLPPGSGQACYLQGPDAEIILFQRLGGWNLLGEQERN